MLYDEIVAVLNQGRWVHWANTGYQVILDNGRLYTIFTANSSMCGLQPSEYKDCFIKE